MIDSCREHLCHFNGNYIHEVAGSFFIEEKDVGGIGKAFFESEEPCILFKTHNNPPLVWALRNAKCADGAFLSSSGGHFHLHIVELKSSLKPSTWEHVLKQFNGMYLSAIAACRLLEVTTIASVTCYIAYKNDRMDQMETANPVLIKSLVGKKNPFNSQVEWTNGSVLLPFGTSALLKKAVRDPVTNDAHFGRI